VKRIVHYELETDDQPTVKRVGESLNMLQFVFTQHPDLVPVGKKLARKTDKAAQAHPHKLVMNGAPFTEHDFQNWLGWAREVMMRGMDAIPLQPEAYRRGHWLALKRFSEEVDEVEHLFHQARR